MKCPRNRVDEDAAVGGRGGGLRDRPTDPGQSRCATEHRGPTDSACTSRATGSCALCARPEAVSDLQVGCTVLSVWLLRDRHTPCVLIDTPHPTPAAPGRARAHGGHAPRARDHASNHASPARPWLHGRRFHTPPRQRGTVTARPQPDPRPSARQHARYAARRMIRDGYAYGTRGTSTLTDHGEPSPRGRGATRGATWCMACAVVSTCMHVEPRGALNAPW